MKKRIRDYGIAPGLMETGKTNSITDVPGVKVGHFTVHDEKHHTGVTVIIPRDDIYYHRCVAACDVINGFGKTTGLQQIEELGQLETPIALTNTLNDGLVYDALVEYTLNVCKEHGEKLKSVNPVVGECNDGKLNRIRDRIINYDEVMEAFRSADSDIQEGNVGAGAGMVCHGLKGGTGTSSRKVMISGAAYTVGMLALCNHGMLEELRIDGKRTGQAVKDRLEELISTDDSGSCIMVLATDLPVSSRQLKRIVRRACAGLARCGSFFGNGSGDIAIGFTTAYDLIRRDDKAILSAEYLNEDYLDQAFAAAAECAEECVLNALTAAERIRNCRCLSEFPDLIC